MALDQDHNLAGSHLMGALRLMGFLGLIGVMVPTHLFWTWWRPKEPDRIPQILHRLTVRLLGFRIRTHGILLTQKPVLYVANHTSYLDIPILGSLIPAAFVAKTEVASWPLFGFLAKLQHSVFIERKASVVSKYRDDMYARLAEGRNLILFPEGTSGDGLVVLPFKSSLFSVVEKGNLNMDIQIQPLSIACTGLDGLPITRAWRPFYTWFGDMTMIGHLWDVFKFGRFTIDVVFHPPVSPSAFTDRKALATYCQMQVAHGIEQCLTGREFKAKENVKSLPAPA